MGVERRKQDTAGSSSADPPALSAALPSILAATAACSSGSENDESAAWLNEIIRELWPYEVNIAQFILLEYIQPAFIAAMPAGLPVPRFCKIDVGSSSPKIEGICVLKRDFGRNDTAAVIEAEFTLDSTDMDIKMSLSDFTFGVNQLKISGRVEIIIRPLLNRIPLVGAVQVAFINSPTVDYNLTGLAAVGNQSMINGIVHKVADTVLDSIAVLPNRVAYKTVPNVDFFTFSTQPVGILRVAAISGEGFPSTDREFLKQAVGMSELPDVYLVLKHGSESFRTEWVDDSANPVYNNQMFDFVLTSESKSLELRIEAYDYDIGINNDDFLGRARVLTNDLVREGISDIKLLDSPENAHPTVKLATKWLPISSNLRHIQHAIMEQRSDTLRPKTCSALLLTVEVDEAHNLPPGKRPYVRVKVGPHTHDTSAAYDLPGMFSVEHPEFEQSFHISLQGDADGSLKIEFHVLNLGGTEELGWAYTSLSEAVEAGPEGKIYNFALMKAQKANATLRVRLKLAAVVEQPPLWRVLAEPSASPIKGSN